MRNSFITLGLVFIFVLTACQSKEEKAPAPDGGKNGNKVTVEEVLQATSYTYLKVNNGEKDYWIAIAKADVKEGETVYHADGMEMKNFESRDLDRKFDVVYFVQNFSKQPLNIASKSMAGDGNTRTVAKEIKAVSVEPAEGGITIAQLYADKESYATKTVKVKGEVVKYNSGIMGRNWAHIQDGTKDGNNYDLTVTTNDDTKIGQIVTFEGVIAVNKDFGAGYSYDVIMEQAKIVK